MPTPATGRSLGAILLVALVLLFATPGWAQIYRWTDDQGELNLTQGLENVPERFRSRAVIVGPAEPRPSPPPPAPAGPAAPGSPPRSAPPGPAAEGVLARVPFVPGAPIVVTARINGGRSVQLLLDTGATHTTISPRALSALGVDMRAAGRIRVQGVTGVAEAVTVMLQSLEVGDAKVSPLEVVAHDPNMLTGEGLLGRDFLDRFQVSIDTTARVVIIGRR